MFDSRICFFLDLLNTVHINMLRRRPEMWGTVHVFVTGKKTTAQARYCDATWWLHSKERQHKSDLQGFKD